jgi:hypothetical protein
MLYSLPRRLRNNPLKLPGRDIIQGPLKMLLPGIYEGRIPLLIPVEVRVDQLDEAVQVFRGYLAPLLASPNNTREGRGREIRGFLRYHSPDQSSRRSG